MKRDMCGGTQQQRQQRGGWGTGCGGVRQQLQQQGGWGTGCGCIIPATGRLRKEGSEFEASLNYMVTKETKFNCKKAHNTARLKMKDLVHGT